MNNWILKGPVSFYMAHERQKVIFKDQLLHVQYPLDRIISDR